MESKTFKKIVNDVLIRNRFTKRKSYYYYENPELTFVIGLQKSNYSNEYYINLGIIIKKNRLGLENLRDVDGDIRARFSFIKNKEEYNSFELDQFSDSDFDRLNEFIQQNIDLYIVPVTSIDKLQTLLSSEPTLLYQTTLRAKQLLGFE